MYTNNQIIDAIKYSGLLTLNRGDEKLLSKKLYEGEKVIINSIK